MNTRYEDWTGNVAYRTTVSNSTVIEGSLSSDSIGSYSYQAWIDYRDYQALYNWIVNVVEEPIEFKTIKIL